VKVLLGIPDPKNAIIISFLVTGILGGGALQYLISSHLMIFFGLKATTTSGLVMNVPSMKNLNRKGGKTMLTMGTPHLG